MNQTAKAVSAENYAIDEEVMDEMESIEPTGMFDYAPEQENRTDAAILDEEFLDDYDDFSATDVIPDCFSLDSSDY
jgi:hypothetical protein